MVNVRVNGEERQLEDGTTVEDLLTLLEVKRSFLAVEKNETIVPRTSYKETLLAEGDKIEVVSLVGGG